MLARQHWDAGVGSETLMLVNLLVAYRHACRAERRDFFCTKYSLAHVRMRQLDATYRNLVTRVHGILHSPGSRGMHLENGRLSLVHDPMLLDRLVATKRAEVKPGALFEMLGPAKLNTLRVILVWVFSSQVLICQAPSSKALHVSKVSPRASLPFFPRGAWG
jgi:hypothetical protein